MLDQTDDAIVAAAKARFEEMERAQKAAKK